MKQQQQQLVAFPLQGIAKFSRWWDFLFNYISWATESIWIHNHRRFNTLIRVTNEKIKLENEHVEDKFWTSLSIPVFPSGFFPLLLLHLLFFVTLWKNFHLVARIFYSNFSFLMRKLREGWKCSTNAELNWICPHKWQL